MTDSKEYPVGTTLGSTEDYTLVLGERRDTDSGTMEREYQLVNRVTGVIEATGKQLHAALAALHFIQLELDRVRPDPRAEILRREQEAQQNPFAFLNDSDEVLN